MRSKKQKKLLPRGKIPIPPGKTMKSDKDYDRKRDALPPSWRMAEEWAANGWLEEK